MISKELIEQLVNEKLQGSAMFLVSVTVSASNMIVVEVDSDNYVDINACAELSKYIESKVDREVEDYELEVGSAGLTSPLRVKRQYLKYVDKDVEVLAADGKKFVGVLAEVGDEDFTIEVSSMQRKEGDKRKRLYVDPLTFKYDEIKYCKYIIHF